MKYLNRLLIMEFSTTNKQNKVMLYQGYEYTKYRENKNGDHLEMQSLFFHQIPRILEDT